MKDEIYELHAEICQTLGNPKRLRILNSLRTGERTVSELVPIIGIRKANLSQHLAVLRQTGIVSTRRRGTNIYYKLSNPKVIKACDIMREVLLENLKKKEKLIRGLEVR